MWAKRFSPLSWACFCGKRKSIGLWAHRFRADDATIDDAADLLDGCQGKMPIENVRKPKAAIVLKSLGFVKIVAHENSSALALTEKGRGVLAEGKGGRKK